VGFISIIKSIGAAPLTSVLGIFQPWGSYYQEIADMGHIAPQHALGTSSVGKDGDED